MQVNANEAEEALAAINAIAQKMRRAAAYGGAHYYLILWGIIWVFGFLSSQFLSNNIAGYIWLGLDILGGFASWVIGKYYNRRVHDASFSVSGKRIGLFWLTLIVYCSLTIWIAWPLNGKQLTMFFIIFAMLGWMAMGFLLSLSIVRITMFVTVVAFFGYFLMPNYFYLWMGLLGGGTMIGCGLYIHARWRQP